MTHFNRFSSVNIFERSESIAVFTNGPFVGGGGAPGAAGATMGGAGLFGTNSVRLLVIIAVGCWVFGSEPNWTFPQRKN